MPKPTLTTIILARQIAGPEEKLATKATQFCDQVIILLDSDETTPKRLPGSVEVVNRRLDDDFAKQRNLALEKSRSNWTLFIDSDEWVSTKLWEQIMSKIEHNQVDYLVFKRHDNFLDRRLLHGEVGAVKLVRAAKTSLGKGKWQRAVHEVWQIDSVRGALLSEPLEHYPHESISDFLTKLNRYARLEPDSRFRYTMGRVWLELLLYPCAKFVQNYILRRGFLDGCPGLVHALLMSYYSLITRVYVYEAMAKKRS